jgi:hypothetical protein
MKANATLLDLSPRATSRPVPSGCVPIKDLTQSRAFRAWLWTLSVELFEDTLIVFILGYDSKQVYHRQYKFNNTANAF